ncbi:hypothetical protein CLV51_102966 [Chitinophaga niastensis]|uniref:Collagen triple helix repeat protein n=1 Tax=Chitinophaga niastensis TaxID=536980 RepID=A0A2P8HPG8_CHINA|nr:hypothetical protein [Chitinophaga niastensis]PSL48104.1 hypothetical protein CLV51_102966 [Chitinophaga niastensis]
MNKYSFFSGRLPYLVCLVFLSLFLTNCSKEGPQGPAGSQGAAGVPGPGGSAGPQGPPGNANVVSGTFTLVSTDYVTDYWTIGTGNGGALGITARAALKNIPAITAGIFNTGTVLVYLKTPVSLGSTATVWSPLPYDIRGFNAGYLTSFKFNYEAGKLRIYYMIVQTDAAAVNVPDVTVAVIPSYDYKYVVIAGTAAARASQAINLKDYNEVARYFNLKD